MTDDDPFGLTNDAGRTRIRPVRGAARQTPPAQSGFGRQEFGQAQATGAPRIRSRRTHENILLASFAPLLELAPELERAHPPSDPEALRLRLLDGLTQARDAAVGAGAPLARADAAAWFVAALLDDLALNTPWGGNSGWPRQPLIVSLSGDVDAGTRFFDRLAELERYPTRDPELMEVAFVCLALGFRGKYRVPGRAGDGSLLQVRSAVARHLTPPRDAERDLAPNWRGVQAADETPRFAVPLWSIAVGAVAVLTLIYVSLGLRLSERAAGLYTLAGILPPQERAEIFRPARPTEEIPAPPFVPVSYELLPEFQSAAPAAQAGAMTGSEDVTLTTLVLQATDPEVFQSARADLNDVYSPLIDAIARVIVENAELIGGVTVIGHTDSIPVQRSNPFASNQGLSEARAARIVDLLAAAGVPRDLMTSQGRAAAEPIADNATREGRARNRRVEIRIQKGL